MLGRTVAMLFGRELCLLQFRIRLHSSIAIASRELKHAVIERVETGQGHELKFVAHRPQFTLKLCDASAIEMQDYHFLYWSEKESRSIPCPRHKISFGIRELEDSITATACLRRTPGSTPRRRLRRWMFWRRSTVTSTS